MIGRATSPPGPASGWFLPVSPKSEGDSPGLGNDSRSSFVRERELQGMRPVPVLVQASEPSVGARKGRQSPRHGASVRYVSSLREQQGRDATRSHLAGKGVGEVLRYKVLDQVIEVPSPGSTPEDAMLPTADGVSITAIQYKVVPTVVGSIASVLDNLAHAEHRAQAAIRNSHKEERAQAEIRNRHETLLAAVYVAGNGRARTPAAAEAAKRRSGRGRLGQRPPPAGPHHAPGAVILDDFCMTSRRPVQVQLAQRKQK